MSLEITKELLARQPPEAQTIIRLLLAHITELEAEVRRLRETGPNVAFVRVELPRGNRPVDVTVDLSPGQYLLGVGRRPHGSLRRRIDVPSGSCP